MPHPAARTVAIVGGGFSGAILALKLSRRRPADTIVLIERGRRVGVGLAYGACAPHHLLNVPAARMELGLPVTFAHWLRGCGADLTAALAEAGGSLADAFVPRALFGAYVEAQVAAALTARADGALRRVRGEVVRVLEAPAQGVVLADGRVIAADRVVLATGNMAPARIPVPGGDAAFDDAAFIGDPWAPDAFADLGPEVPILLIGAGLTMADIVLQLSGHGHRGAMTALSRHGWRPNRHAAGGAWAPFLAKADPRTPLQALRLIRRELERAQAENVPWQRVFDAARPDVARVWRRWDERARRGFLRRLRTLWDVHRHRMAPRIADAVDKLEAEGRLSFAAGRVLGLRRVAEGLLADVDLRHGGRATLGPFGAVVNCTGPRSDFDRLEAPLFGHLRRRGLIRPDPLRLGLETQGAAVLDAAGAPSEWLYAVGPLTRPALWEVTAVPEINAQIDALVARLDADAERDTPLEQAFADLGAGI